MFGEEIPVAESGGDRTEHLVTLTHARLRVAQGDLAGARRILDRLLAMHPGDSEARRLLQTLPEGPGDGGEAGEDEELPPRVEPDPVLLSRRFRRELADAAERPEARIHRLRRWLDAIRSRGGNPHA